MAFPTPSHANPAAVRIQRSPPQRRPAPFANARLVTITRINHSPNSAATDGNVQSRRRPAPFSMAFYDGEVMIIEACPVSPATSPNSATTDGHAQSRRRHAPFSTAFYEGEVMIIDARPVSPATEETAAAPTVVRGLSKKEISRFLETSICEKEEAAAACGGGDPELCAICQEIYREKQTLGVLRCRHRFHAQCIGEWLEIKNVCPLCNAVGAVVRNQD